MATKIFPTVNDVNGGTTGDGKNITENNFSRIMRLVSTNKNYVSSGFTVPTSDVDLIIPIAPGEALIQGYWVDKNAGENITLAASSTNYVYLKLVLDGSSNVTGAIFEANTTGTAPANSILIFKGITDGTGMTSRVDRRYLGGYRGAIVSLGSAFSIPNNASTVINFPTEEQDTDGIHDLSVNNSRLTVPVGVTSVAINFNMEFANNATGRRHATILKNGGVAARRPKIAINANSSDKTSVNASSVSHLPVVAGDYFELQVYQTSGGALDAVATTTWLEMKINY